MRVHHVPNCVCVEVGTVFKWGVLDGELHPQKTFSWLVDALILKSSIKLVFMKKDQLILQKVDGATLTSKSWELHNLLIALLVLAENLNLSSGGKDQSYCGGADEGAGGLGQASTRGKKLPPDLQVSTIVAVVCF